MDDAQTLGKVLGGQPSCDPEVGIKQALRSVRTHLNMDVAYISDLSGDTWELVASDSAEGAPDLGPPGTQLEKSCTYCHNIAIDRLPQIIEDTSCEPIAKGLPVTEDLEIRAHLSVPLRQPSGEAYGMFCCYSTKPDHSLRERDLAVLKAFAAVAAENIQYEIEDQRERRKATERIAAAFKPDNMDAVFQPIYDIRSSRLVAAEALCRFLVEPRSGPDAWFHDAEIVHRRTELEIAALRTALRRAPVLRSDVLLSLNASPSTLLDPCFANVLSDIDPRRIILEITEQVAVSDYQVLRRALEPLRARGIAIAVDDMGGGYANLQHILELQPDLLKADMSLTRDIHEQPARQALMAALVSFAEAIDCRLVAEGVETKEELEKLRELGVSCVQGYHLCRPMPPEEFGDAAERWTSRHAVAAVA